MIVWEFLAEHFCFTIPSPQIDNVNIIDWHIYLYFRNSQRIYDLYHVIMRSTLQIYFIVLSFLYLVFTYTTKIRKKTIHCYFDWLPLVLLSVNEYDLNHRSHRIHAYIIVCFLLCGIAARRRIMQHYHRRVQLIYRIVGITFWIDSRDDMAQFILRGHNRKPWSVSAAVAIHSASAVGIAVTSWVLVGAIRYVRKAGFILKG